MILKNKFFIIILLFFFRLCAGDKHKPTENLIFIYNAESGMVNTILDYIHKVVSPETYECNLCILTYNNYGKIKEWDTFINILPHNVEFKYRDDLEYLGLDLKIELPVLITEDKKILLTAKDINLCNTLDQLISILLSRLGLKQN